MKPLTKQEFIDKAGEAYDKAHLLVESGDNEKMMGRLISLDMDVQNGDIMATLEVLAISINHEATKETK